mmetsp:Transcript_32088/g.99994  ORF Transcript_32088/g.99994 Transcript_32088/m.99994 type:complete len:510 (-) Transcript_32088:103-1632(-)
MHPHAGRETGLWMQQCCTVYAWFLVLHAITRSCSAVEPRCQSDDGSESCAALVQPEPSSSARTYAEEFWSEIRQRGLQLKLKKRTVEEKAQAGKPAHQRIAMVLSDDVFYGRAIMKIPRHALLSIETAPDLELRRELNRFLFEDRTLARAYNVTGEDATHLLSLAYPLISESRNPDSAFREWLDATQDERLLVLELTERQRRVLQGTTVEGAYDEMARNRDLIQQTASNLTYFRKWPVTSAEATWALAVVMRHARVVHPHQDVRESRDPRMYLFPLTELLDVQLHPDPGVAVSFQEEITLEDGKREEEMVLQIARRDMPKGEEVFLWPGRLSNSEMVVRHGIKFPRNPVGIGRNITQPPNWSPNKEDKVMKEYDKYQCATLESFELRFSPSGQPMQAFVRCYRVSWFLTNGWYSPGLKSRLRELNRWPPPKQYSKDDWLAWTQADAEVNRVILDYCHHMRQQLKDSMDAATAQDFRSSRNPTDRLLWQLRGEESKTFKECIAFAKRVKL